MNSLVIEHLKADELPRQWAEQLKATPDATFTVRIEAEEAPTTTHGAFGLWQDREDVNDVEAYLRNLRQPRR